MRFDDLLQGTLPSKSNASLTNESEEFENRTPEDDVTADVEKDLESIDLDNVDDEELDDIDEDDLAAIDAEDDDDETAELSDDEEVEADQTMALAATPTLLQAELNEESAEDFLNEFPTAVYEGFLLDSDSDMFVETSVDELFSEARVFAPKTRVQLNEKDRRKQLFEIGVQASARAHNDPVYWKLQKCYKLERLYKAKLRMKYRSEALKRVKAYVKKLKASSSKILNGIGNKILGK